MSNIQSIGRSTLALAGAFVLALTLPGCASFGAKNSCGTAGCTTDQQIATEVQTSLDSHPELGPPGQLRVSALNRVVYLNGTVSNDFQRSIAKSLALQSSGDDRIVNSIEVTEK